MEIFDRTLEAASNLLIGVANHCPHCGSNKLKLVKSGIFESVIECPICHIKVYVSTRSNERLVSALAAFGVFLVLLLTIIW